jgi:hypothetical protein
MLLLGSIVATLALAPADTTVLVTAKSFLWVSRPLVQLVHEGGRTELLITTRDPDFFTRPVATLYTSADTAGHAVAVLPSDSSFVDARYSTNRHTLRFIPTAAQLNAWAGGDAPSLEVGGTRVKLSAAAREKVRQAAGRSP